MSKINNEMIQIIKTNTKKESMRILGISKRSLDYFINYYALSYVKETHKFKADKSKRVLEEIKLGGKDSYIAKKIGVSRQYVNYVRKVYEKENNN